MAAIDTALDAGCVDYSDDGADPGGMVGLPCAWVGRILGLGPGVEPGAGGGLVYTGDLWHLRGTQRHYQFGTFVCLFGYRHLLPGISRHRHCIQHPALPVSFAETAA